MSRIKNAFKQMKIRDVFAPIIFLFLLIPSLVFRLTNRIMDRKLWLVAEDGEARDNGYHFYKYVREEHPEDYCFYAINKNSSGYEKVAKLGNVINYGSLKHWLYYMTANLNISSQKSGNPCPIFWYFIHVVLRLYKNRAFLQHGITHNDSKWLYYNKTRFSWFICGTEDEYEYIREKFGYPEKNIALTGFPRWDDLKDVSTDEKTILIMPTWRNWLSKEYDNTTQDEVFLKSEFFEKWNKLLNDEKFTKYIESKNISVYFYPHVRMRHYLKYFKSKSDKINILSQESDIQEYFNKCNLMITDYSSVAFDFAYLDKPVIYYQFDIGEYRKKQLQQGYFDYTKNGFGPVVYTLDTLLTHLKDILSDKEKTKNKMTKMTDCSKNVYEFISGRRNKVKVMQVVNSMNIGGIETFLMRAVRNLKAEDKYEFVFLTNKPGEYDYEKELIKLGARFVRIKSPQKHLRVKHLIELNRIMKEEKPDIVHCHTYFDAASVMLAARRQGVKTRITHSHTAEGKRVGRRTLHKMLSWIIRKESTEIVACSKEAGEALFGKKATFDVIPNMVDIEGAKYNKTKRAEMRKSLGIGDDKLVIGHVGRLAEVKNHKFLIEIFSEIKKRNEKYKMIFVGDGGMRDELRKLIKNKKLENDILLLGNRSDVSELMNAFDIFVFPSIYEGLPTVLIEAQANGLPVVASSAISYESKINKNFEFLSLSDGTTKWCETIVKTEKKRIEPSEKIKRYSTENVVKRIKALYNEDVK